MAFYSSLDLGNGELKAVYCGPTGLPETVRSSNGGKSWPSYVAVTTEGKVLVGQDAREHGLVYTEQVASGFKMHLGDPTKKYFKGTATATDVAAMAIGHVIAQTEKQSGTKVDGLVVTCPANFTDVQKQGLLDSFSKVGVKVLQLVTEPAAAAYAYCFQERIGDGRVSYVCCADLGHGTFDVSILEVKKGVATPISTEGVPQLGGRDFTEVIKGIALAKLGKETGKPIQLNKLSAEQAAEFHEKAEKAKHALSGQSSTNMALGSSGKTFLIPVTQAEFESASAPLVKKFLECMDKAIKAGKKDWKDIEKLVLAGGAFQSVKLQDEAANQTGLAPCVTIDPSLVVATGAALHAYNLAREEGGLGFLPDRPILKEATGHDVGVAVVDDSVASRQLVCAVVVPKNTPVPHIKPKLFRLERPNQTDVFIEVLQGPDGSSASQCSRIGVLQLKGLPPELQRTERIEVEFKFDSNTLVTVTATDKLSGISHSVSIKLSQNRAA